MIAAAHSSQAHCCLGVDQLLQGREHHGLAIRDARQLAGSSSKQFFEFAVARPSPLLNRAGLVVSRFALAPALAPALALADETDPFAGQIDVTGLSSSVSPAASWAVVAILIGPPCRIGVGALGQFETEHPFDVGKRGIPAIACKRIQVTGERFLFTHLTLVFNLNHIYYRK